MELKISNSFEINNDFQRDILLKKDKHFNTFVNYQSACHLISMHCSKHHNVCKTALLAGVELHFESFSYFP